MAEVIAFPKRKRNPPPHGLERVVEHLPEGKEPGRFAHAFVTYFRAEIDALIERGELARK